jgi:hypothetical protein
MTNTCTKMTSGSQQPGHPLTPFQQWVCGISLAK